MTRDRLIVEANPVEGTVDQVLDFRLEIRKSRESESIDPTGAGLMTWKDGFVDDGNGMPKLHESCSGR